jgi:predicted flap endonuclease-1-like 5' DNA nuclease
VTIDPFVIIMGGAAVIAAVLLLTFFVGKRRQRIDLGETTATQTLARKRGGGASPIAPPATDTDLLRIKGLGPRAAAQLSALGFGTIATLATLDEAAVEALDQRLGAFSGRVKQDRWVEQARLLHAGDIEAYRAEFGALGDSV